MFFILRKWFIVFALTAFLLADSFAQNLNFTHLTINEGLSQNTIYSLYQDKTGFIWIGTEDGLNRYDGYEFKIYRHQPEVPNSISSNQINGIYENAQGNLWVATSTGLDFFDRKTEKFSAVDLKLNENTSSFVTQVLGDKFGNIWLGTYDGIKALNAKTGEIKSFSKAKDQIAPGKSKRTYTLFIDKYGIVWAGIGSEIIRIDSKTNKVLPTISEISKSKLWGKSTVRAIAADNNENIWICTEKNGLFCYDVNSKNLINYSTENSAILSNTIRNIFIKNDREIWLGTRDGLSIFNKATGSFSNSSYNKYDEGSLSHNSVRCFLKDRSGSIWLGTFSGGINILENRGEKFYLIREKFGNIAGVNNRVISSLTQTSPSGFWIGTEGGGLNFYNRDTGTFSYYFNGSQSSKNPKNLIKAITTDYSKNLWVGSYDGLSYFNVRTKTFTNYNLPPNKLLPNNNLVYSLFPESGGVWVGTNGGGLTYIFKNGVYKNFIRDKSFRHSISSNNITSIIEGDKNNLWVGTENGLNRFDKETEKFYPYFEDIKNKGLSSNSVLSLLIDSKNRFWVGTKGGGLNMFNQNGKSFVIDTKMGLANDVIHAILEDNSGNIWVSTNSGLSEIIFKNSFNRLSADNINIRNYTNADGLQSNQFSAAAWKSGSGELFFGGISGISYFRPENISLSTYKPEVVITDLLIKNNSVSFKQKDSPLQQPIDQTHNITLKYDEAFITLKFAALNFINPSKNQYAYRLLGLKSDDDWHYVGNQRNATYTNLPAGNYIFKVKASNNDGIWSGKESAMYIKVLPPPWKTWWAYMLYTLTIGFLLYLFYYYSVKTTKLKSELDIEHLTREKELELTQRKMSFFTNISHEIKTPLTLILAPIEKLLNMNEGNNKIQNQLMLMQRNGEHLLKLINQLLDFRKFESGGMTLQAAEGNMVRFVKEVVFAFKSYAEHKKVGLKIDAEKASIRVWFDRDKFEKILFNLISNSLKFTRPGGIITVSVKTDLEKSLYPHGKAVIKIKDTGKGIKAEFIDTIFEQFNQNDDRGTNASGSGIGLSFTKGLIDLHHGSISVISVPEEKGKPGFTEFSIDIPLGKSHLSDKEIIADYKDSENIGAYYSDEDVIRSSETKSVEEFIKIYEKERQIMLIVEDNPDVLEFISSHFEEEFKVEVAVNGLEGWEKACLTIPDIIISDVMMPEMSGTELCSRIKSDSRTSHIPVILLTARTPLIFKIEGLETGADDYITKPFNLGFLEARIWNLLESRKKLRDRFSKEITLQPANIAITSPDEKFLEKAMAYIEANIVEPSLSVEELGKQVAMSRVTLYRKIKALTNQTTIEFIRTVRLKRAAQLLEQNKFNVNEVSYLVGFTDVDYFRKCFKEQFGYTPKEYALTKSE